MPSLQRLSQDQECPHKTNALQTNSISTTAPTPSAPTLHQHQPTTSAPRTPWCWPQQGLLITQEWIDVLECGNSNNEDEFVIHSNARCILVIEKEGVYI